MWDFGSAKKKYDREVARLGAAVSAARPPRDSREPRSREAEQYERHLISIYTKMMEEHKQTAKIGKATIDRLEVERTHWFKKSWSSACSAVQQTDPPIQDAATHPLVQTIAQTCIFPRSTLSPTDAEFCARFMKMLHDIGTPGYSTIAAYATVSVDVTCQRACLTILPGI